MLFDPENKVVKLCAHGMALEAQGKKTEAHALFSQAWDQASNDFEAFTAAHYMARNQSDPKETLHWNEESLRRALLVKDETISGHYASLYLNVGKSCETLGKLKEAAQNYQLALESSADLGSGPYSDMIRSGISEALKRTGTRTFHHQKLENLIHSWCERKELRPLSFVLPAYVGMLGTEEDLNKLISALSYLSATKCLNEKDQEIIFGLIREINNDL